MRETAMTPQTDLSPDDLWPTVQRAETVVRLLLGLTISPNPTGDLCVAATAARVVYGTLLEINKRLGGVEIL
jgi:hypothetical protein